ncbi:MAG: phosphatase PAP2 family protein [Ignavibacteria bacterium]
MNKQSIVNHRFFTKYLFIFLIFLNGTIFCSDSTNIHHSTIFQDIGHDIITSLDDGGSYVTLPLHTSGEQWFFSAGIIDGLIIASTTDLAVKGAVKNTSHNDYNKNFWDIPTAYGEPLTAGIISTGVYFTGLFSRNNSIRVTGRMLFESVAYAGVMDLLLKYVTGRDRPYFRNDQYWFNAIQTKDEHVSFPSGHTTMAFAVSTVLAERIDNLYARIGLYGLAGLTGCARIINNKHWLTDVLAGGLLGFGTGYYIVHLEKNRNAKKGGGFSFYPSLNGLNFNWKW